MTASGPKPQILFGNEAGAIRDLTNSVERGELPHLYVTNGEIVRLERVSGDTDTQADDPLPFAAAPLTATGFASVLAHHAYVYRLRRAKPREGETLGELFEEEYIPPERVLKAVLSGRYWPGVPPLRGIVGSPVLRPDGSLLQAVGYDTATGLYYAPKVELRPVPARPTRAQVVAAKRFVDRVVGDFPWVTRADKTNYLGILVSPILRPFVRALIPFGMITATTQGSGKTLLSDIAGVLYGKRQQPWPENDEELRKTILGVLAAPEVVIVFDNLEEGTQIKSPVLAGLLTAGTWSDRVLGSSRAAKYTNDRMWLATGNNLRLGGDMATRTVSISIDPDMPNPELRTNFAIGDLGAWLSGLDNRRELLWSILVLVADWVAHGAPRSKHVMRQFTPWAQATGGFVAHHGLPDFLGNADEVRDMDDDQAVWHAFLARWEQRFGTQELTSAELRSRLDREPDGSDSWEGTVPDVLMNGRHLPSAIEVGKRLGRLANRWQGPYVLRVETHSHSRAKLWHVERQADE